MNKKEVVITGSGGCMRELVWQMQEQNKEKQLWDILGYVDEQEPLDKRGVLVGNQWIPYLGDDDYLLQKKEEVNVVIGVGEPLLRKKIADKLKRNPQLKFPHVILLNARICEDVQMGEGCVISMDARISTNVEIGDFVFLNTGSMICHDGRIGDFVTLSPRVTLAGNVRVGAFSELGMGTSVRQGIRIGEKTTAGAGSVIVKDIKGNSTIAGVPAEVLADKKEG